MSKVLISAVIGVVGTATLASSVIASSEFFDSTPIDNVENNITILKDKVVAYSNNEEKLVSKYMRLYEEYTKLKEATEQNSDVEDDKKIERG